MANKAAAIAPELDPATARIGGSRRSVDVDDEDEPACFKMDATPKWYGSSIPAPLKEMVQKVADVAAIFLG